MQTETPEPSPARAFFGQLPPVSHPWGRWHVAGRVNHLWGRRHRWHESTTSGVVGTWRQPPLGSLACRWHESTTSGVAGRGRRHLRGPETPGCRHLRGPETPDSDLYIFGDVLKYLVCIRADARSLNININPGISITAGTPRQHPRGPEPLNRAEPIRIISISLRRI